MKDQKMYEFGFKSFHFVGSESSDVKVVCSVHVCLPSDTEVVCPDPVCWFLLRIIVIIMTVLRPIMTPCKSDEAVSWTFEGKVEH